MKNLKGIIILTICFLSLFIGVAQNELVRISVSNNDFVKENGETLVFRGLNTSDPDKLENQGLWKKSYFEEIWDSSLLD